MRSRISPRSSSWTARASATGRTSSATAIQAVSRTRCRMIAVFVIDPPVRRLRVPLRQVVRERRRLYTKAPRTVSRTGAANAAAVVVQDGQAGGAKGPAGAAPFDLLEGHELAPHDLFGLEAEGSLVQRAVGHPVHHGPVVGKPDGEE